MMPEPRLVEPDACRWCSVPRREHVSLWKPPVGWHQWAEPTDAQRLERMKARRAARQPAPPQPPTGLLAGAPIWIPARVQLRRVAGWRKPPNTVVVSRPTRWGNPFVAGATTRADWHRPFAGIHVRDRAHAVALLRAYLAWRSCKHEGWSSRRGPNFPWES